MPTELNQPKLDDAFALQATTIREHWKMFLFEGILLTILGVLAIALPMIASLTFTLMIGWLLLISGIFGVVVSIYMRNAPGFWWSLLSALLAIGAGVLLIGWPVQGTLSLTIVLGAYFIAEGVASIMYAVGHKATLDRWGWLVAAGIVDILLGLIIFAGLPGIAGIALGLLVGINLVIGGTSLIGMALAARSKGAA